MTTIIPYNDPNVSYDQSSVSYDGEISVFIRTRKADLITPSAPHGTKANPIIYFEGITGAAAGSTGVASNPVVIRTKKADLLVPKSPHKNKQRPYEEFESIVDP